MTVVKYAICCIVATAFNILFQELSIIVYSGNHSILISIFMGTGVGLIVKYCLDKKYIFEFDVNDRMQDLRVFVMYASIGVLTTAIFWGFELYFHYMFESKIMRYTGGVIGLFIGYYVKYILDKKIVFVKR